MPIERAHQRSILRQWRSFGFAVAVVKLDLACITLIHTVSSGLRRGPAIVFLTLDLSAKLNMDLKERFFGDSIERVEPFRKFAGCHGSFETPRNLACIETDVLSY